MPIRVPAFPAGVDVVVMPGEGVLLVGENATRALHGALYEAVAPLIDGVRDADAVAAAAAGRVDAVRVYYVLALLEKNGHIVESPVGAPRARVAFWQGLGVDPRQAESRLAAARVRVTTAGRADAGPLREALRATGVVEAAGDEAAELEIVLTDDCLTPGLGDVAAAARAAGRALLAARPLGMTLWLGPLTTATARPCLECLRIRHRRLSPIRRLAEDAAGETVPGAAVAALPASARAAAELTALEAARFLATGVSTLADAVLTLDCATGAAQRHLVLPAPACPCCGAEDRAAPAHPEPPRLTSRRAAFTDDGGHRVASAHETLERLAPLVGPVAGIAPFLAEVAVDAPSAHVWISGTNTAQRVRTLAGVKSNLRQSSAGKGRSRAQARVGALCEALERYSAERRGDEWTMRASWAAMRAEKGGDVFHPNDLSLFSDRQYAGRDGLNAAGSPFNFVPERLPDDLEIEWSPAWSFSRRRWKYVPTRAVYFDPGRPGEPDFTVACSNGCAAGNTLEEAVLQGFFELAERDATAIWWYNRLRRPGVDPASFNDPWIVALTDDFRERGRDLWALDLTHDLGVPVFAAVMATRGGGGRDMLFGLGCHLDARVALQRAFAEITQMLSLKGLLERDPGANVDPELAAWLRTVGFETHAYMTPDPDRPLKRLEDFPALHSGDLLTDVERCREIVEAKGMELLAVDMTRRDVGLAVARVMVPGLRHFWARFAPGRLYDVPAAMGWLPAPSTEDDLNPAAIFF